MSLVILTSLRKDDKLYIIKHYGKLSRRVGVLNKQKANHLMTIRKKKGKAKSRSVPKNPPILEQLTDRLRPYQREITGGLILFITIITLLGLLSLSGGTLSQWWADVFSQLFGWGAIPATILLGIFGGLLLFGRLKEEDHELPLDIIIGVELLFVIGLTMTHLFAASDPDSALLMARNGQGGGFVGWGISTFFKDLIGIPMTTVVLLIIGFAALGLMFQMTVHEAMNWAEQATEWAQQRTTRLVEDPYDYDEEFLEDKIEPEVEEVAPPPAKPRKKRKAQPTLQPATQSQALESPILQPEVAVTEVSKSRRKLPPLKLLAPASKKINQNANARYQAQIIEETLQGFGIPVEVVEINQGPTVVQFGLRLGTVERKMSDGTIVQQRIRVNKIVALSNDLALALSAAPIRIEAPVPGRPLVGIEVPSQEKTMVSLRSIMETSSFKEGKGALQVALGKNVSGQAISASLSEMPHLLIAGATGSGKSVCLNTLITTLLMTHTPEQLRFLMIDPKMVELTSFNGIPHLVAPVVTDFEQVVGALAWVTREMDRRYQLFATARARSLHTYNQKVGAKGDKLPHMVVIIDELADLMMMAPDDVERSICRIAQMARATGIHLIIATQRPSTDVVTGLIKANFPTRIAFAVSSQIDSRVILDTNGAEKLLGKGDMLYMAADSPKLARLQGCFVSDNEIKNIVDFWRVNQPSPTRPNPDDLADLKQAELPWADILAAADKDDLLEEAIKLVIDSNRASTSLLQRRLGIGYPRASRLMDQLEEEGVIGPAEGSKPREVRWNQNKDEADYDEFEKDVASDELPPE